MRSLYVKIYFFFWLASTLIILSTAYITSEIAKSSSIPERERLFMDSYLSAAVITYEKGGIKALKQWLVNSSYHKDMSFYLISKNGQIFGSKPYSYAVADITKKFIHDELNQGIIKSGNILISHETLTLSNHAYRLIAVSDKPFSHFVQIPWANLTISLALTIIISGFICYLLSLYLTKPLRFLSDTARQISKGELTARVGVINGHKKDEIARLGHDFNVMAQKLQSMIESKNRLLQDISHELRTPLARLQLATELARKKTNQMAENEFNRIDTEAYRLNKLIGEILEYSRLEHYKDFSKKPLHLGPLILQIIDDALFEFSQNDKKIIVKRLDDCLILGEERLIHRAIENIIRNALKYSPTNHQVTIHLLVNNDNQMAELHIADNGPGIPNSELDNIFLPFYRVDTSRGEETGGFGLGLAIAYQAITSHQGNISIKNKDDGGLLVTIYLPILNDNKLS